MRYDQTARTNILLTATSSNAAHPVRKSWPPHQMIAIAPVLLAILIGFSHPAVADPGRLNQRQVDKAVDELINEAVDQLQAGDPTNPSSCRKAGPKYYIYLDKCPGFVDDPSKCKGRRESWRVYQKCEGDCVDNLESKGGGGPCHFVPDPSKPTEGWCAAPPKRDDINCRLWDPQSGQE
jgi:hypothetical protein